MSDITPGWTPYRYGFNNPVQFVDPTGLSETEFVDRTTGERVHLEDGKDQVIVVDHNQMSTLRAAYNNDCDNYNGIVTSLESTSANTGLKAAEFQLLVETLYAESSGGISETQGIVNVLKNRANNQGTSLMNQLKVKSPYGVYGVLKTSSGLSSSYPLSYMNEKGKLAELKRARIHMGAALGLSSSQDLTNGAFFWDGMDIKTNEHYMVWGLTFTDPSHNLWGQKSTIGSSQLSTTAAIGQTIFSKFRNQGSKWYISK